MKPPVTIGGIFAPDSELARKAAALAGQAHSRPLLNHVHRTWWFAEFIGKKRQMKYDRELVYLASLLHDLGLSEDHAADMSLLQSRLCINAAFVSFRISSSPGLHSPCSDLQATLRPTHAMRHCLTKRLMPAWLTPLCIAFAAITSLQSESSA
ncbi:hypothetical protein [Paraburkholderia phenoliruptrix]|uniref:HD domain-containing protein n=1 Tax=Paraburkholderia phenoliruptrix TaxID=252970 RepID=A0A6J5KFP7_9BURK|nr:hypothetical protein LMG9964_06141 [Paraburkholderia phenoliruptrix]